MNTILTDDELPPLQPQDHPEPHSFAWTEQEMRAIRARDRLVEAAVLAKLREQEPVGFMSPKQLPRVNDPEGEFGTYIPVRKTPAGNFTLALYAAPLPAVVQVPLSDDAQELIGAMVSELRQHRWCGDCYPENGWPEVNKVLADYAKFKRQRAAPEAPAQGDPLEKLTRIQEELGLYNDKPAQAIPAELDVRRILLDVVPGDGSGQEVYARNVDDVVRVLTELSEKAEAQPPAPAPWREAVKVMREALDSVRLGCEGVTTSDWRTWEELASLQEFERWAKSRAAHMAANARAALAQLDALEGVE